MILELIAAVLALGAVERLAMPARLAAETSVVEQACIGQSCVVSGNFAADLAGEPDTRPGAWGKAGCVEHRIRFGPPEGYTVKILHVYGDFIAWPTARGKSPAVVPSGRYAGVLWGLQTTAPEGSVYADWAADNTFLYVQSATRGEVARTPVDLKLTDGVLLEKDHILRSKMAVWLNDTGLEIHMEATYTLVFRFEKAEKE